MIAARLPGVEIALRHRGLDALPDLDAPPQAWREWLDIEEAPAPPSVPDGGATLGLLSLSLLSIAVKRRMLDRKS